MPGECPAMGCRHAVLTGVCLATLVLASGCARRAKPELGPAEAFSWCAQPVSFSPPPPAWRRESERSGGLLGVRFVLSGGLGECITVATYSSVGDRDAASSYAPTLADLLPRIRLRPERMQEPWRWRLGYEHDTTLAGFPAFASDDTLITPERPMLYHQVFWVVNRCAFNATYQGTKPNVGVFDALVASIRFPEDSSVTSR